MGRRLKLTKLIKKCLIEAIEIGCTDKQAADYAGISVSTFYKWKAKGRNEEDKIYIQFLQDIKKAETKHIIRNLAVIRKAAEEEGVWTAAAWILERGRGGFVKNPEVEINIDTPHTTFEALCKDVRETEKLISELKAVPVIDLDE